MSVAPVEGDVGNSNDCNSKKRRANVFDLDKLGGAELFELEELEEKFDWDKVSGFVPLLLRLVVTITLSRFHYFLLFD